VSVLSRKKGVISLVDSEPESGSISPSDQTSRTSGSEDLDLWSSVAKGDLAAFEKLVRRHQASLVRFLDRLIGNRDDAEDVAQETLVAALRKAQAFKGRSTVRSWLFGIAKNSARVFLRSHRRRQSRERGGATVSETGSGDRSDEWVRRVLEELPRKLREALILCDLNDFTYEEAAEVLRCPVKTVSTRLFRARERIAATLRGQGPE